MKIALVNMPFRKKIDDRYENFFVKAGSRWPHAVKKKINEKNHYLPFPFFLGYTAALLANDGHDIRVIDAVAANIGNEEVAGRLRYLAPDLLVVETATPTIDYDLEFLKQLKSTLPVTIVLAGTHSTVYYETILKQNAHIDYIAVGEYELIVRDLCRAIAEKGEAGAVKGVAFRKNGETVFTGQAAPIEPLDILPRPALELFPLYDRPDPTAYWDSFCQYAPAIQMHASRGCPYGCYFCLWPQIMYRGRKYRMFTPARIVDEMEYAVKNFGAKEIYFDDDDFTVNRQQVLAICREIRARKLEVKWSCMGDAINLDEELLREMYLSGCVGIKFGVESGSATVLKDMGKPVDLARVRKVADLCARYRIRTRATFSFGLIGETMDTLKESMAYAEKLNTDTVQASICVPYPGTKFYAYASEHRLLKDFKWIDFDGKANAIVSHPNIRIEYLESFRKEFVRHWLAHRLMRPSWLWRQFLITLRGMRGQGMRRYFNQTSRAVLGELGLRKTSCSQPHDQA